MNPDKLAVSKSQSYTIQQALSHWQAKGLISKETVNVLENELLIEEFDWNRMAKYAFIGSSLCIIIAFFALLGSSRILDFLEHIELLGSAILFAFIATILYSTGYILHHYRESDRYMSGAIYFLAVCITQVSVWFFMASQVNQDTGIEKTSEMISWLSYHQVFTSLLYAILAIILRSQLIWVFAVAALGNWLGAKTLYTQGVYAIGLSVPEVTLLYGGVLLVIATGMYTVKSLQPLRTTTLVMGLLYAFVSLWVLSLVGSSYYMKETSWVVIQYSQLGWSIALFMCACISLIHGLRFDWALTRGFGLTFLGLSLYTKFFEYFWASMPKALFFTLLAVSFWIVGSYAEGVLHRLQQKIKKVY